MISRLKDKIEHIVDDSRAVSPAVGVALLVAITVILAAVIGFVVLDTNAESTDAKNARLDFDTSTSGEVTISHEGGDSFNSDNIVVKAAGADTGEGPSGTTFNTGDEFTVTNATTGDTVVVFWEDPESDREVQIGEVTVE